ncbi:MAG: IS110 family transposase [Rhodospirillales bacterium]|nr:IS110 family transposase [Rhodospirillales bacterium]
MFYVGLDVHWRSSTICIFRRNRGKVKSKTIRGHWDRMISELARIDQPFELTYEASCGYGTLYERLSQLPNLKRIVVAHPGKLPRTKQKNDRVDAQTLATLLMVDRIPAVHVPNKAGRDWRRMIEYRTRLVQKRTRCKNALRALLRTYGIVAPRGLWSAKGRTWLGEAELPDEGPTLERDLLMDELDMLNQPVHQITTRLNKQGAKHPAVTLLQTIPGIGPRTAEAFVACIDHPARFANSRKVSAYFGLVPMQDSSGPVHRLGHITRQGPATLRRLLTEAAWQARRLSPTVGAFFDRIVGGKPQRRKIAIVATANYLARCMFAMLRSGELWCEKHRSRVDRTELVQRCNQVLDDPEQLTPQLPGAGEVAEGPKTARSTRKRQRSKPAARRKRRPDRRGAETRHR